MGLPGLHLLQSEPKPHIWGLPGGPGDGGGCSLRGPCLRPGSWGGGPALNPGGLITRPGPSEAEWGGGGQRWRRGAGRPSESRGGPLRPAGAERVRSPRVSPALGLHPGSPGLSGQGPPWSDGAMLSDWMESLSSAGSRASSFLKGPHLQSRCLLPGGWACTGLDGAPGRRGAVAPPERVPSLETTRGTVTILSFPST